MDKSERTRNLIIEISAPIFNMKGYEGTSLSDITEKTGFTKGAIYGHFENKDDLAIAALEYNLKNVSTLMFENVLSYDHSCDRLKAFSMAYAANYDVMVKNGGCPVLNAAVDSDDGNPRIKKRVDDFIKMWRRTIVKIVNDGISKNEILPGTDAESFASIFIALTEGGFMASKTTGKRIYIDHAVDHIIEMINAFRRD